MNVTPPSGAVGTASAVPIIISFLPSVTPVVVQSALSRRRPPLTGIFWRSGGTPVSANNWALNTEGGADGSMSRSYDSFCHLTETCWWGVGVGG